MGRIVRLSCGLWLLSSAACTEPLPITGVWRNLQSGAELTLDATRQYVLVSRDGEYYSAVVGGYRFAGDSIVFQALYGVNNNAALGREVKSYYPPPVPVHSEAFELRGDTLVLRYTGEFLGERFPVTRRLVRR
jgi:hypothetical protein